jgi:hypothetical protein
VATSLLVYLNDATIYLDEVKWSGAPVNNPSDFQLSDDILPIMETLAAVFDKLEMAPTHSEYKNILNDVHLNVHTELQLIHSLYGWMEGINRELLYSPQMQPLLTQVIDKIQQYHGMDEVIIES